MVDKYTGKIKIHIPFEPEIDFQKYITTILCIMLEVRKRNRINENNGHDENKDNTKEIDKKSVRDIHPQSSSKNISIRVFSRVVVIFSLLIVVYFSSKNEKLKIFARQSDMLAGKGQVLDCSSTYVKDIYQYEGCFPKECKRYVTDKVLSLRETDELLVISQKGLKLYDSDGGLTTLDLDSGALLSNGRHISNIYQNTEKLLETSDFNAYRVVKEKIKYAIAHHFGVEPSKLHLTPPVLISEIKQFDPKRSLKNYEYWHPQADNDLNKVYHYTAFVYLNDYELEFKGGRFVFVDENVNKTIEPRKGRLNMFTSGGENTYYVEKIISGSEYYLTFHFTCDKIHSIEDLSNNKYAN